MKITIQQMVLTNFKGIRSLTVKFSNSTNIFGRNASGKTTIFDAFLWLFFGKDSTDRTDFEIKTLDDQNKPYHNLDHEVSATITVDGQVITIRKVFREKWTKKRGSNTPVFDGHTNEFFWNEVPLKESEYKVKIAGIIDEKLFKLLTNTSYFNSMKWQDRRNVLLSMAGTISDSEILGLLTVKADDLKLALSQGKTIEEFKREIAAKRKNIKDKLDLIPTRIEEANRNLPEEMDYAAVEKLLVETKEEIIGIDQLLNNKSAAMKQHQDNVLALMKSKQDKKRQLLDIESAAKNEVADKNRIRVAEIQEQRMKLRELTDELTLLRQHYKAIETRIDIQTEEQNKVREEWHAINNGILVFDENEFCCPTCKRAFEEADIEIKKAEMIANFNTNKSNALAAKQARGIELKDQIEMLKVELKNKSSKGIELSVSVEKQEHYIAQLEEQHNRLSADEAGEYAKSLIENIVYNNLQHEISSLDEEINKPAPEQNNSALTLRKSDLQKIVDGYNQQLGSKQQRETVLARIKELKDQEAAMSQEYASLDGIEYSIEQFNRAKMDALEQRVNGRFKMVRFQMFEEQINGGQADACITLVNSNGSFVPYADANTAAKIQAGLDIINTLSNHYGIQAPVWIDNRESVTDLPETDCQLINLIVSPEHSKLTVMNSEAMAEVA